MKQATQSELLLLAEKHASNAAVRALRTSLLEGKCLAEAALASTSGFMGIQRRALDSEEGFSVCHDNSAFVADAAKASAALSRMASDYLTLASVLQSLGEDVSY